MARAPGAALYLLPVERARAGSRVGTRQRVTCWFHPLDLLILSLLWVAEQCPRALAALKSTAPSEVCGWQEQEPNQNWHFNQVAGRCTLQVDSGLRQAHRSPVEISRLFRAEGSRVMPFKLLGVLHAY